MTGDSFLSRLFASADGARKKVLAVYFPGGFPTLQESESALERIGRWGPDVLEVGVPFSDPVADGPIIQAASDAALSRGATLERILEMCSRLCRKVECAVVLMSYYNPLFQYGLRRLSADARRAGVRGMIVPDLLPEEAAPLEDALKDHGLENIRFITPSSRADRVRFVARGASGFLYCVSVAGVTGPRQTLPRSLPARLKWLRRVAGIPVCVGFGISTPEQAAFLGAACDGIIVGSRVVELWQRGRYDDAERFVRGCRRSLDGGC